MKRLLTNPNGGFPLKLSDFRWLSGGLFENTQAVVSTICPAADVVILSGCDRSVVGTTVSITAGWVTYNGEVFRVAAHSFTNATSAQEYWDTVQLFDPEGSKIYANSITHDTYEEVVYKVVTGVPPVGTTEFVNTKKYVDLVTENLVRDSWHNFKSQAWPVGSFFGSVTFNLFCLCDLNGFVHLQGDFGFEDIGSGAMNELIATLPVGFRPTVRKEYVLWNIQNNITGELGSLLIEILTNGEIRARSSIFGYAGIFDFSQIPPFMAAV